MNEIIGGCVSWTASSRRRDRGAAFREVCDELTVRHSWWVRDYKACISRWMWLYKAWTKGPGRASATGVRDPARTRWYARMDALLAAAEAAAARGFCPLPF